MRLIAPFSGSWDATGSWRFQIKCSRFVLIMFQVRYDVGMDFSATHVFDETAISLNLSIEDDPIVGDSYSPLLATSAPQTSDNTGEESATSVPSVSSQIFQPSKTSTPDVKKTKKRTEKYNCDICSYRCIYRSNLVRHIDSVHNNILHQCTECTKSYSSKYDLQQHTRALHGEQKILCEYCSQMFNNRYSIMRHCAVAHKDVYETTLKSYECPQCQKKFVDKRNFQGHINKHADNRPYKCSLCQASFIYQQNYNRHQTLCRGPKKMFNCSQCDGVFRTAEALKDHTKGKHGDRLLSCVCGKMYTWRQSLARHQKIYTS